MFTSPEALLCSRWRKLLLENDKFVNILAIVVDEARCIVKWLVRVFKYDHNSLPKYCPPNKN